MKKHKGVIALLRDKGPLDKGDEMAEEIRALMRDYPSDFYIDMLSFGQPKPETSKAPWPRPS